MSQDKAHAGDEHAGERDQPDSPSNSAQSEMLRGRILDAAREAFFDRGYPTTTREDIASRAGVSPDVVYDVFGGTRGVLVALMEIAVHGEDSPMNVLERPEPQQMRRQTDQRVQLHMLAEGVAGILDRAGPLYLIMRHAAHSDEEIAVAYTALHDAGRQNMGVVAGWIAANGPLKGEMTIEMAGDVLWTLTSADVHHLLRVHREWSVEQYREWLTATLIASLLP
jgi:AcrR family transcriptional regulator